MIEINNITKTYGHEKAVDDFSLEVRSAIFGFLGQNGAGKTTVMKMIVGLTRPDKGTIKIGGKSSSDIKIREHIGFMPENPYFYDRLTGLEFLRFANELFNNNKKKNNEDYGRILKQFGIYEAKDKFIRAYSKGMKQRLGLAQALINEPEYIFLDEPLDGLDPIGRKEMKEVIKNLKAQGRKVFFNSHILYDIEELCDGIGVIHEGKLLYTGSVKDFCGDEPLEEKFVKTIEKLHGRPEQSTAMYISV